jgi:hypothetical protein
MITLELPKTPEENAMLGLWAAKRIKNFAPKNFSTIAFFEKGVGIIAVALFHNYRVTDVELAFAALPKTGHKWGQRDLINMVLRYPFDQLKCNRCTMIIRKDNMFIYGLLPGENRYERVDYGQEISPRRTATG